MTHIANAREELIIRARKAYRFFLNKHTRLGAIKHTADYLQLLGYPPAIALDITHSL